MLKNAAHSGCANWSKIDDHFAQKLLTEHGEAEGGAREGLLGLSPYRAGRRAVPLPRWGGTGLCGTSALTRRSAYPK